MANKIIDIPPTNPPTNPPTKQPPIPILKEDMMPKKDDDQATKALKGAAAGAAIGAKFGPVGAAIGAAAGALFGWGSGENDREEQRQIRQEEANRHNAQQQALLQQAQTAQQQQDEQAREQAKEQAKQSGRDFITKKYQAIIHFSGDKAFVQQKNPEIEKIPQLIAGVEKEQAEQQTLIQHLQKELQQVSSL